MCIDLGWTRDEVLDQIDIPFLFALRRQWNEAPPVRKLKALELGYEKSNAEKPLTAEEAQSLMNNTGGMMEHLANFAG